jgi:hypothetical protein
MSISEISMYNILRKKIGEEETTELMEFVKSEVRSEVDAHATFLPEPGLLEHAKKLYSYCLPKSVAAQGFLHSQYPRADDRDVGLFPGLSVREIRVEL